MSSANRRIFRAGAKLRVVDLEPRWLPAQFQKALFPDPVGPQSQAEFGRALAASDVYRVVGGPKSDVANVSDVGQAFVFALTNDLLLTLDNPTPAAGDQFGFAVAASNRYVVVGTPGDDAGANNAGSAYVFDLQSPTPTTPIATLKNTVPASFDQFGYSVAIFGNRVAVGMPYAGFSDTGSVAIFDLASANPSEAVGYLSHPNATDAEHFGWSMSTAGNLLIVGAPGRAVGGKVSGAANVYDLTAPMFSPPLTVVTDPTPEEFGGFGTVVAISSKHAAVGAIYSGSSTPTVAGEAHVFSLSNPATPIASMKDPLQPNSSTFGWGVAIQGERVYVGAGIDSAATNKGAIYTYDVTSPSPTTPVVTTLDPEGGSTLFGRKIVTIPDGILVGAEWSSQDKYRGGSVYEFTGSTLSVSDTLWSPTAATDAKFGSAAAISGNALLVAAYEFSSPEFLGRVHLLDLAGIAPEIQLQAASDGVLGSSVALANGIAVVGAHRDGTTDIMSGRAFLFSAADGALLRILENPTPDYDDNFGAAVAVSENTIIVAAPNDHTAQTQTGSVYFFDATTGALQKTLVNPYPTLGGHFGSSLAIAGGWLVIGAEFNLVDQANGGAAYVYDLNSPSPYVPKFVLDNPDSEQHDLFGHSVAIDGQLVVVGAYQNYSGAKYAGSAFVYDLTSATPTVPFAVLDNPAPEANDGFGWSVAVSGKNVAVGAYSDGAIDSGTVYLYDMYGANPAIPAQTIDNPTPAPIDYFGGTVVAQGNTLLIAATYDDTQNVNQGAVYVYRFANSPQVVAVSINGGSAQRSRISNLSVHFDANVDLPPNPATAFQLTRQGDGAVITTNAVVTGTMVTLTITGGPLEYGTLADGQYQLRILAQQVNGGNFDGNNDGIAGDDYLFNFHRLFGDSDGDRDVDVNDFAAFRMSFGGSSSIFDFDNDGDVDAGDFGQFRARFGASL